MPLESFVYEDPDAISIPPYQDDGVERDPEARRLREACYRMKTDRSRRGSQEFSFADQLDELEILTALHEQEANINFTSFKECADITQVFHKMFEEMDMIPPTSVQESIPSDLHSLTREYRKLDDIVNRLPRLWFQAVCSFTTAYEKTVGRIGNIETFFGCSPHSLDEFALSLPEASRKRVLDRFPMLDAAYKRFRVEKYVALKARKQAVGRALKECTRTDPQEVVRFAQEHFNASEGTDEWAFDTLIGIRFNDIEGTNELYSRHGREQVFYQGTPYDLIRDFLKELHLTEEDTLYDLGCGYGRIPLYGAMTTPATFKGIEIISERVADANALKERFKLDNVLFQEGNVLEQDYSDGTVFFLFNPFEMSTLERVNEQLQKIAKTKKIRVVSVGPSTRFFKSQSWIEPLPSKINHPWNLSIFESV